MPPYNSNFWGYRHLPIFRMDINSYKNLLSFERNFVPLHTGTVFNCESILFLHLQKYNPIIIVPNFSLSLSSRSPFSRNVRRRGSRSVAKRFSAPHGAEYFTAYGLFPIGCLVFSFANIVTFHFRFFSNAVGCGLVEREILDVVDFRFAAIRSSYDGDGIQSNVVS